MSFKEFVKELKANQRVEGELLKTIFYSFVTSVVVLGVIYYFKLKFVEDFFPRYGFFLLFAVLSYALFIPTIKQVRAYERFGCMSGMMIGMTIGMIAGFAAGFYIGATNGMFIGGVFGMAVGIILGVWMGSCCGVMGFMEGIMAGFMGGWMGAMTSVMLINDHLKLATGMIFVVTSVIMVGLNYMIYTETKETERQRKEDNFITLIITLVLTIATTWLMVFGPRSLLFS
ncbi:hypothetical protein J4402_04485 [Candidatus Pacearchaeota archaeon]|nr:hypothetical protein [Candidatus Pacearchaeota archaeon]